MDAEAIFNTDPLYLKHGHKGALDRICDGPQQRSSLHLAAWMRGHFSHCDTCRCHCEGKLEDVNDEVLVKDFRQYYADGCYGARVLAYLKHGYLPAITSAIQEYHTDTYDTLYENVGLEEAWDKQKKKGIFVAGNRKYVASLVGAVKRMEGFRFAAGVGPLPKCRVCWDGSRLNAFLAPWRARFEDFPRIVLTLRGGEWYAQMDISGFYLLLPIHASFQQYLSFKDPFTGEILAYRVLPFGLATATTFASGISAEAGLIMGPFWGWSSRIQAASGSCRTPPP